MKNWSVDIDADGIATILFDCEGRSVNTLGDASIAEFQDVVARIAGDAAVVGAVIASAKPGGFCAGGDIPDLDRIAGPPDPAEAEQVLAADFDRFSAHHVTFRKLETCGKPIACAIEGVALGAGVELALACHHRVASSGGDVRLGFPEAAIGLLPGGGGTQRLPRLTGLQAALKLLMDSKPISAEEAKKIGLVDQLVEPGETLSAAKRWVREAGDQVQPWDKKGFKMPGGAPYMPGVSDMIAMVTAVSRKQQYGLYPAQMNILSAVYEGTQAPFDAAQRIETRYFVKTLRSPQAKAMLRSLFLSPKAIKAGASRPRDIPAATLTKAAVIGAGLMGAGIAYVQAKAGIETVLIDRSQDAADKGKAYAKKAVEKAVARGTMSQEAADALLARITPTTDYGLVEGSQIVIEAVFEDRAVKAEVTRMAEAQLGPDAVMASNTSTLPITGLATASVRPANFIGLHFFSPVERMNLVEIIRGDETGDAALAAAIDYVARIGKTPIVVKDSRGFYTSRTITKYLDEPCEMLMEGIAPAIIENVGRMTGMPLGPLELADAIGLELPHHLRQQTKADLGDAFKPLVTDRVLEAMVVEHGRFGRRSGKGFYDYSEDGRNKSLWPGLADLATPTVTDAFDPELQQELKDRLLYSMALEAAKCIEEGVIDDPREVDVGALMGFGFPAWTGGPASLIDQVGVRAFVARCDVLADRHGERFRPGDMLRDMAQRDQGFYES